MYVSVRLDDPLIQEQTNRCTVMEFGGSEAVHNGYGAIKFWTISYLMYKQDRGNKKITVEVVTFGRKLVKLIFRGCKVKVLILRDMKRGNGPKTSYIELLYQPSAYFWQLFLPHTKKTWIEYSFRWKWIKVGYILEIFQFISQSLSKILEWLKIL